MQLVVAVAWIAVATGCGRLAFDPHVDVNPDADAATTDARSACTNAIPLRLPALADTVIHSNSNVIEFDGGGLYIGTDIGSPGQSAIGIVRFDLPVELQASLELLDVSLDLPVPASSNYCGGSCGSCLSFERTGELGLAYMRSDWEEGQAGWFKRLSSATWQSPGAVSLDVDVSAPLAAQSHVPGVDDRIQVPEARLSELWRWRDGSRLSFRVEPMGTARTMIDTPVNTCVLPLGRVISLNVVYCQP